MKKLLAVALVLCLLVPCAVAEDFDFASYDSETLHRIVDLARNELINRELKVQSNLLIFDYENVQVYLTGKCWLRNSSKGEIYMDLEVIGINNRNEEITVEFDKCFINGWQLTSPTDLYAISAGKKKKDTIIVTISDANISTTDEIEDMEMVISIYSVKPSNTIFTAPSKTVHFK